MRLEAILENLRRSVKRSGESAARRRLRSARNGGRKVYQLCHLWRGYRETGGGRVAGRAGRKKCVNCVGGTHGVSFVG